MRTLGKTAIAGLSLLVIGGVFAGLRWFGPASPMGLVVAAEMPETFFGKQAAPEFPTGLDWINTGGKIGRAHV